jgi:hypothetical protein
MTINWSKCVVFVKLWLIIIDVLSMNVLWMVDEQKSTPLPALLCATAVFKAQLHIFNLH